MNRRLASIVAVVCLIAAGTTPVAAREIRLAVDVDHRFLHRLLLEQVYGDPGSTADVWRDENGCSEIVLANPRVGSRDGLLSIDSAFDAKLGAGLGNWCLGVTRWQGRVDVVLEPSIHPQAPIIQFRVIDSHLYDPEGNRNLTGTVWDWFKARVHPRLELIRVDLFTPLTELKIFLPLVLSSDNVAQTQALVDSVRIAKATATADGLNMTLSFDVPERTTPLDTSPLPVPTLTAAEVERWHATLDGWDAFVTFLVKRAGRDVETSALEHVLADVLLEARYDLLEALRPSQPGGADPVRPLFLKTWERIAPVLRDLSLGLPGEAAARYMSLVTAGDALAALDELGPEFGFQISADGLRRLARMVEPLASDPTEYRLDVDPDLRKLFGFGDPLPLPPKRPTPTAAVEEPSPTGSDEVEEESDVPPSPQSGWFDWLLTPAFAAAVDPATLDRLYRWVPKRDEMIDYLKLVRPVLRDAAQQTQVSKKLDPKWHVLFGHMVLATAWQETCWRQFVRKGKTVDTIRSPVGALGIMQINARVWRGFYDVEALADDIAYNARAGTEILHHYMIDYAVAKKEHEVAGGVDNLPRATYAAYNAGPGRLRRYRQGGGHRIDRKYWEKFELVRAGKELSVASCFGIDAPQS